MVFPGDLERRFKGGSKVSKGVLRKFQGSFKEGLRKFKCVKRKCQMFSLVIPLSIYDCFKKEDEKSLRDMYRLHRWRKFGSEYGD